MQYFKKIFKYFIGGSLLLLLSSFLMFIAILMYDNFTRYKGEIILLPNNYIGYIYIVYDDPDGLYIQDNGKMVYSIPKTGVYVTSLKIDKRLHMFEDSIEFFYSENNEKIKKIPYIFKSSDINKNENLDKIVASLKMPEHSWDNEGLFGSKPYLIYQIDSFKNLDNIVPPLTIEKYLEVLK